MSQARSRASELRTALAAVMAGVLLLVLPLSGVATASDLAALSLVVLALASTLALAPRFVTALRAQVVAFAVAGEPGPPVLRTRKTDPQHHPLAPRAPGLA